MDEIRFHKFNSKTYPIFVDLVEIEKSSSHTKNPSSCCNEDEEILYYCSNCGNELFSENEVYYSPDDEILCESCYCDLVGHCSYCDDSVWYENLTYLPKYEISVCEHCLEKYFTKCCECGEYVDEDDAMHDKDENPYCASCSESYLSSCSKCEEFVRSDEIREFHDKNTGEYMYVCEECFTSLEAKNG